MDELSNAPESKTDDPEPRVVNLPAPEILWSMAVKSRDGEKCVVCEAVEELTSKLFEGKAIVAEDGRLDLDSGATLCARCSIKYDREESFRAKVPEYLKPRKQMRLNVPIDRDLYAKFAAVCRFRGTSLSRAVRELVQQQMDEVEDGHTN